MSHEPTWIDTGSIWSGGRYPWNRLLASRRGLLARLLCRDAAVQLMLDEPGQRPSSRRKRELSEVEPQRLVGHHQLDHPGGREDRSLGEVVCFEGDLGLRARPG